MSFRLSAACAVQRRFCSTLCRLTGSSLLQPAGLSGARPQWQPRPKHPQHSAASCRMGFHIIGNINSVAGDGFQRGYFLRKFVEPGLLNPDGSPGPPVLEMQQRAEATGVKDPLHIGINVMLTNCQRWESIMVIVQVRVTSCAPLPQLLTASISY